MTKRYAILLFLIIVQISSHIYAESIVNLKAEKLKTGVTSSLNKVFQTQPYNFKGTLTQQAKIELALNEHEATQLVLFPETNLTDVTINIGPLIHENTTDKISPEHIQINPIGYVNLHGGKKTKGRTGFHPDILLPNQPLNLQQGIPQPILITVFAPPETKPGLYYADLTVKDKNELLTHINLEVRVHPILIPKQPHFKSLSLARRQNYSNLWPEKLGYKKLSAEQERGIFKKLADIGFRNHLPPTGFLLNGLVSYNWKGDGKTYVTYPTHNRKTGEFDAKTTDEYIDYLLANGANSFFIGVTSDIYKHENNSKEREAILLKYLDDLIPHLKKRGVLEQSYLYNIDEPWGVAIDHAKKIYRLVKQRYGYDIHVIQNTNQNNNRIHRKLNNHFQAIDINLGFYKFTQMQKYREKSPQYYQDVWWNLNAWPRKRPNLFLEYPLIDARIIGPMSFKFNIQGFEYWELTYIGKIKNYAPVKASDFQLDWIVGDQSLDGLLLYPNEKYDFYSSMRFESFRDGMEDLELLYLLQQLDPDSSLLKLDIVNDIDDYSESINQYLEFRERLFTEIATHN